jgi:hypothetical protein
VPFAVIAFIVATLVRLPILFLVTTFIAEMAIVTVVGFLVRFIVIEPVVTVMVGVVAAVVESIPIASFLRPFLAFFPEVVVFFEKYRPPAGPETPVKLNSRIDLRNLLLAESANRGVRVESTAATGEYY